MKGKFIVLEGPDRCGKSTQAQLLYTYLVNHGYDVILTREPGGTPTAERIRNVVLEPGLMVLPMAELLLYQASRAQHTQEKIIPELNAGKIVICDRYTMSTSAYQGYGRGIDLTMIQTLNDIATQGINPDLTIVFLMSDSCFTARGKAVVSDRLEQEGSDFRKKMRNGYEELVATTENAYILNADEDIITVSKNVRLLLEQNKIIVNKK